MSELQITHPLVVLDLETTGVWVEKDKIVEVGMIKFFPNGDRAKFLKRVNPGMPIPQQVSEIIGITNEDVKNEPPFKDISADVLNFIADSNIAGFNVEKFDLPLLEREMFDAGIKFDWKRLKVYDAQKVYHLNEKRDLTAAYKFYCEKNLDNAHSAEADAEATFEILCAQIKKYGNGTGSLAALDVFHYRDIKDFYDRGRKFRWWNGELYPMFGKYAKRSSLKDIAKKDPKYLQWMLEQDFPDEVKELVEKALQGEFPEYQNVSSRG